MDRLDYPPLLVAPVINSTDLFGRKLFTLIRVGRQDHEEIANAIAAIFRMRHVFRSIFLQLGTVRQEESPVRGEIRVEQLVATGSIETPAI
jgi:hypothetical protein